MSAMTVRIRFARSPVFYGISRISLISLNNSVFQLMSPPPRRKPPGDQKTLQIFASEATTTWHFTNFVL